MKYYTTKYEEIISIENLLEAYQEFKKGKRNKLDVMDFEYNFINNIFSLHKDLKNKIYQHSNYKHFKVRDPKERDIHKASVRDRVIHHAIYKKLYPFYDKSFIADSYSCRINKGTHKAMYRFRYFLNKESKNYRKQCWVLKCDIRKFFASIDHNILLNILKIRIQDENIINLLKNIISSFETKNSEYLKNKVGLPLGNLTSQLLVNIYMNEFDQYVKYILKVKYYIRYADDFVLISNDKKYLENTLLQIDMFLKEKLKLNLHPNKVFIKTIYSGIDFLGFVHFPDHRILRTSTKKRMFRKLKDNNYREESVNSYLSLLSLGNGYKIRREMEKNILIK